MATITQKLKQDTRAIASTFQETQKHQGWLGSTWDWMKNNWGSGETDAQRVPIISNIKDLFGLKKSAGSDATARKVSNLKLSVAQLDDYRRQGNTEDFRKQADTLVKDPSAIQDPEANWLAQTDSAQSVLNYRANQEAATNVISDVAAGATVAAIGIGTAGFGLPAALAVGASVKTGIKWSDAATGGREYGLNDLGYDAATGALAGGLSAAAKPLTTLSGNVANATLGGLSRRAGLEISEQAIKGYGGSAGFGAIAGGSSASTAHLASGGNVEDLPGVALQGATAGALTGTAFHGAGQTWQGIKSLQSRQPRQTSRLNSQPDELEPPNANRETLPPPPPPPPPAPTPRSITGGPDDIIRELRTLVPDSDNVTATNYRVIVNGQHQGQLVNAGQHNNNPVLLMVKDGDSSVVSANFSHVKKLEVFGPDNQPLMTYQQAPTTVPAPGSTG
jgi:hypothetical protein